MMKIINGTVLAASLCLMAAVPAYAGHDQDSGRIALVMLFDKFDAPRYADDAYRGNNIKERIHRQHRRIARGVESGQLTRKQAAVLKKKQRKLHRLNRKFAQDSHYSVKEKRVLTRKLDKNSKRIAKLKHDEKYTLPLHRQHRRHGHPDRKDHGYRYSHRHGYGYGRWKEDLRRSPRIGYAH